VSWKQIWGQNLTSVRDVVDFCHICKIDQQQLLQDPTFPVSLPRRLAEKIESGNIQDPIFRQFVPFRDETVTIDGFLCDPLHESEARPCSNLLIKYHGRALLVATQACGMHCRFCFRRHFPYTSPREDFSAELSYLQSHPEIEEVILSGGDPLALPTDTLAALLARLEAIPHIRRLRFHTRLPIGIPERIDEELLASLSSIKIPVVIALHVNHPKELDTDVQAALHRLKSIGIMLLSQTVLLKGINDSARVLCQLMRDLTHAGVLPYYLHQLDRVGGTHHFEVPVSRGQELMRALHASLSGYMVPRYVQERPKDPGKRFLFL
jgi:EF-P beta-lysylation protein EpmB